MQLEKIYRHHNSQGCTLDPRPASKWHEIVCLAVMRLISNGLKRICTFVSVVANKHKPTSQHTNFLSENFRRAIEAVVELGFIWRCRLVS